MEIIDEYKYRQALAICRAYQKQINGEIAEIEGTRIKDFIEANKKSLSKRLINIFYRATEKGHIYISDLNERNLLRIGGCGVTTLEEFKNLKIKPNANT
jgi:hypothetical protein